MPGCGETINFFLSSWGRNRHLQLPVGLFGGDDNFGLPTYKPVDEHYRTSASYSSTVSIPNGSALRAPVAAWFHAMDVVVSSLTTERMILSAKTAGDHILSANLLMTVQQTGKYITIISNAGEMLTCRLDHIQTTVQAVHALLPTLEGAYPIDIQIGQPVMAMLRHQAPNFVWSGPVKVISRRRVRLEVDMATFSPPVSSGSLVYIGALSNHPTRYYGAHPVSESPYYVFAIDAVTTVAPEAMYQQPSSNLYMLGKELLRDTLRWGRISPSCLVGSHSTPTNETFQRVDVQWAFAEEQEGFITVLVCPRRPHQSTPWLPSNGVHRTDRMVKSLDVLYNQGLSSKTYYVHAVASIANWNVNDWVLTPLSPPSLVLVTEEQRAYETHSHFTWTPGTWQQTAVQGTNALYPSKATGHIVLVLLERFPDAVQSIQSRVLPDVNVVWWKLVEYAFLGWMHIAASNVPTGFSYIWPYPWNQPGHVQLLAALDGRGPLLTSGDVPRVSPSVWFVVDVTRWDTNLNEPVLQRDVRPGDRVLIVDNNNTPMFLTELREDGTWATEQEIASIPNENLLVLLDTDEGGGWFYTETRGSGRRLTTIYNEPHKITQEGMASSITWRITEWEYSQPGTILAIVSRAPDLLYAIPPSGVDSSFFDTTDGIPSVPPVLPNRYDPQGFTDGLLGPSVRWDRRMVDHSALRLAYVGNNTDATGRVRINFDMGRAVEIRALAWALVADELFPTITLHGSNESAFFADQEVLVRRGMGDGLLYTKNTHELENNAQLLWQATFTGAGSLWRSTDVEDGSADVWVVRLDIANGQYQRLFTNGKPSLRDGASYWHEGHVYPAEILLASQPFRYYAFTVSVGLLQNKGTRFLEIQEVQPLIVAPLAPSTVSNTQLVGQQPLSSDKVLVDFTLSRDLPENVPPWLGYIEHWSTFITRSPFYFGSAWSSVRIHGGQGNNAPTVRRATVSLPEIIVPRSTLIRSLRQPITAISFMWAFVRHGAIQLMANQAMISHRILEESLVNRIERTLQPPPWIDSRDTMQFHVAITGGKTPCNSAFIGLSSSNTIQVEVIGSVGGFLPELCFVLPNGEVLDFLMYDEGESSLPFDVVHDDYASMTSMFTVQFESPPDVKRMRTA